MSDDKIASTLGLVPLEKIKEQTDEKELPVAQEQEKVNLPATQASSVSDDTVKDIEQARSNIQNIIEQGDEALAEMIELAKQSESPRAFEVASTLMKTLLDANKDFVEMSHKKKFAKEEIDGPKQETNVTNNNLIVSTTDLLKMLKGEADGESSN